MAPPEGHDATVVVTIPARLVPVLEDEREFAGDLTLDDTATAMLTELLEQWTVTPQAPQTPTPITASQPATAKKKDA